MKKSILVRQEIKSIFIVDDAEWHNVLLKKILDESGYQVAAFTDGNTLLENIKKHKPHLIISDIDMPKMDGLELCKKLKNQPDCENIPIIFLSSMNKDEVEKNGAVGFMQKPFDKQSLLDAIAQKL